MAYFQKKAIFAVLKLKICSDASTNLALNFFYEDASILDAVCVSYQLLKPKLREKQRGSKFEKKIQKIQNQSGQYQKISPHHKFIDLSHKGIQRFYWNVGYLIWF